MSDRLPPAPLLSLDKVEWRVQGKPTQGDGPPRCRFVAYADARDIAALLDEWVGPDNWSDAEPVGGYVEATVAGKPAMWCTIGVRSSRDADWVTKKDVGVPSDMESQKGLVSDAFKRAGCAKWGAGRNVYDLPTLWAPCRVTTKQVRGETVYQAWPTKDTLPSILAQLKELGFDVSGGRVAITPEGTEPVERDPAPASNGSAPERPEDFPVTPAWIKGQLLEILGGDKDRAVKAWESYEHDPGQPIDEAERRLHSVAQAYLSQLRAWVMTERVEEYQAKKPNLSSPEEMESRRLRRDLVGRLELLGDEITKHAEPELQKLLGKDGPWRDLVLTAPAEMDEALTQFVIDVELAAEGPF